jgi:3-oxoacyl-[acyl-carrier protein] reductase
MGRVIAEQFLQSGASVTLFDLNATVLRTTEKDVRALGEAIAVVGDTSLRSDVRAAVHTCIERFGALDIVVAQAGIGDLRPLLEIDDALWAKMISVNLTGVFLAVQESAGAMVEAGRGGSIVVTSSTNSFFPETHTVHYSTTKGGVTAFVRAAALDLAEHGIRINAVSPGIIRTPLASPLVDHPQAAAAYLRHVPMQRFGDPIEVARVVLFLASDDTSYMTGADIVVDGGATLGTALNLPDHSIRPQ